MDSIRQTIHNVRIGQPVAHSNMAVFPLFVASAGDRDYETLDEALTRGTVKVSETSESGRVPELLFVNEGGLAVLLLDGEELLGAKQNRVLNLTILAPAGKTIVIPVSCVEARRWNWSSREFSSSENVLFSQARAKKAGQVSFSLAREGRRTSDQGEIWSDIRMKEAVLSASSATAAMSNIYEQLRGNLDAYLNTVRPVAGQTGALFALDGRIVGCDLFDHPETLSRLIAKIVRSYALDAIESRAAAADAPPAQAAQDFLNQIADARMDSFPALGLGEDVRISDNRLAGGALVAAGRVVHLSAFRISEADRGGREPVEPRVAPWSLRRMWRRRKSGSGEAA